jgi:anaerobic selenocysteine-containing dehydrogenase
LNSSFVNVQSLRDIEGEPAAGDAPRGRAARGIADGALVRVFNDRGRIPLHGRVNPRARPAWSTAWASGGASWGWTAPTSTSSPARS